uniref:RING-CH-type domain-containing protein n=1 Tax=Arion vulgaris TaxID=1028688 RepID=A0A0B6YSG9_9EUPU
MAAMDTNGEIDCDRMDPEKEKMQALLERFSTTVDPSNNHGNILGSLPNTHIHSSGNIHSCPGSRNSVNSFRITIHNISPPVFASDNVNFGSSASGVTSASLTPLPSKKFKSSDSDAGTDLLNICRICQLPGDGDSLLFSPCRCSGSLQYVHYSCLLKWIEVSTRKTQKIPKCELCHFLYVRHKRFKFHNWLLPHVSSRDKCLHSIFLISLIVMVICAIATVMCFLSDNGQISQAKTYLSTEEVITLTCGVMFFVSFFLAMTAEITAHHTIYRIFLRFVTQNTVWHIEPYDKSRDLECPKPYKHIT